MFKFRKLRRKSNAGIKRSDILHFFHHVVNAAFIHGLEERAVVLQAGKRAGAEAPFDVYVCTSLIVSIRDITHCVKRGVNGHLRALDIPVNLKFSSIYSHIR